MTCVYKWVGKKKKKTCRRETQNHLGRNVLGPRTEEEETINNTEE